MKPLWLIGGLGLGAGLMYMLDPEKGERRRDFARAQLAAYGRQAEHFLDDTTRTIGRQGQALLARTPMPRRYQPGPGERLWAQTEQSGTPSGLLMLSLAGLGIGLLSLLEPNGGPKRRAMVRNTARNYWHKAGRSLGSTAHKVPVK
jgi:hypothetical protein